MSIKTQEDKTRGAVSLHQFKTAGMTYGAHTVVFYPWTARQKRREKSSRKTRKQDRAGRLAAKFAKKAGSR